MRSSATASVCESVCRVRDRIGDESHRLLVALRISTRGESGRRNQKGFVEGVWRRMHVPASTLKESVVVVAPISSSSANGAVEGATWTWSRLSSGSWALRWMSLVALEVSGEAIEAIVGAGLCATACGLLLCFRLVLLACAVLRFSFVGFVHGFFQLSGSNGPLSPAVRMTGGRPRRYWAAIASTRRRFAARCSGSWCSRGNSSMVS